MPRANVSASAFRRTRHVQIRLALVAILASACATANDPTRRSDIRAEVHDETAWLVSGAVQQDRTARDLAGDAGVPAMVASSPCVANPASKRCAEWRRLIDSVAALVAEAPRDRYVVGHATYGLARVGEYDKALEALGACATERWWCQALRGHVFAESGRIVEAGSAFDSALTAMPDRVRCEWTDLSSYVWGGAWPAYSGASCLERLERLKRLWWLADPSWLVPGNDREVAHYNRMISLTLRMDSNDGDIGDPALGHDHSAHIRPSEQSRHKQWILFGTQSVRDPALRWRDRPREITYGVIPRAPALLEPFDALPEDWPIVPAGMMEHYEPAFGRLAALDHQVAFFERGDSLLAVAAADMPDSLGFGSVAAADVPDAPSFGSTAGTRAVLFLQTAHGAAPLAAEATAERGRWLFRVHAPRRRYIVGIEARSEQGVGRARFGHGLPHYEDDPLRLSDLLLFEPASSALPDSVEQAASRMRGSRMWNSGDVIGALFEVYGAEHAGPLHVSVELDRRLSGHPSETRGVGGGEPFRLEWLLPDSDEPRPVSFTLDLRDVEPGEYILRASVGPANAAATVTKVVRVVAAAG